MGSLDPDSLAPLFCCLSHCVTAGEELFSSEDGLMVLTKVSPTLRQNSGVNKSTSLGPDSSLLSTGPSSTSLSSLGQNKVSTSI